jgi:hypothetical protein
MIRDFYLFVVGTLGLMNATFPIFPFYHKEWFSLIRTVMFAGSALFGVIPAYHALSLGVYQSESPFLASGIYLKISLMY